jgi:hypothetical protein
LHNITATYSGNRLTHINNALAYNYDANGNMNRDYRKNLDMEYNLLNLPYQIIKNDTVKATYTYLADGMKFGQPPSRTDIKNSKGVDLVFGMRNKTIYFYNKTGVIATVPFVTFKK